MSRSTSAAPFREPPGQACGSCVTGKIRLYDLGILRAVSGLHRHDAAVRSGAPGAAWTVEPRVRGQTPFTLRRRLDVLVEVEEVRWIVAVLDGDEPVVVRTEGGAYRV